MMLDHLEYWASRVWEAIVGPHVVMTYTDHTMPPGYVTTKQAAVLTGYSEQQIRDAIRSGVIKLEDLDRIGPMWLIREAALKGFKPRPKGHQPGVSKR